MSKITSVEAWEVLDSRGHPTVRVAVEAGRARGRFTVPAGASTGTHEATERRDGGTRYDGLGVTGAIRAIEDDLASVVVGREVTEQRSIDEALAAGDRIETHGANAVLGVSGAVLHAACSDLQVPLYEYLGSEDSGRIPLPMINVLSGGLHAEGGIEIQDFLLVPVGADDYPEALEMVWAARRAIGDRLREQGHRALLADEGGFAPPLDRIEDAFEHLEFGVREAGYDPGSDLAVAVDLAATHFYDGRRDLYRLDSQGRSLDRGEFIELIEDWVESYPIVSIEDPLQEDDWEGWRELARTVGEEVQILGDDLLVTDADRLTRAIETGAANAVLVKPNQTGTITKAIEVTAQAKNAGVAPVISARSGETCDSTIADLAVGLTAGQIKIGSLARSERLAKYNRLLEIDRELETGFGGADGLR